MKRLVTIGAMLLFSMWGYGQDTQKPKTAPASARQQTAKKTSPTLGFNNIKDVPPIMDSDAMTEEQKLEKELPGNQFVHDKRAPHETALMNEFVEGFKNSKECNGITFYLKSDKKPASQSKSALWATMTPNSADKHGLGFSVGQETPVPPMARPTVWAEWEINRPRGLRPEMFA